MTEIMPERIYAINKGGQILCERGKYLPIAVEYVRADTTAQMKEALVLAREALIIGLKIRNDVSPLDYHPLERAITAIDNALKGE